MTFHFRDAKLATALVFALSTEAAALPSAPPSIPTQPAPTAQPAVYQVMRPTDGAMSCEQLMTETNSLSAAVRDRKQAQAQRLRAAANGSRGGSRAAIAGGAVGAGAMMGASQLGGFIPIVGPVFMMGSALSRMKHAQDARKKMEQAQADAMAPPPEQDRVDHLEALSAAKHC